MLQKPFKSALGLAQYGIIQNNVNKEMNKRLKILLGIVIVITLIMFFLPNLIKNYVINNSKELIGRQIDIGKLKYNYFSSTLKVCDFKMFEQNEQDEFTTFDTLIINLEPYRFLFNEKVVEQFYIGGLMVKTVMKDSTFNFDDLVAFNSKETDSISEAESDLFKYEISNIELHKANLFFNNKNVDKETHIANFSFIIPFIGWNQEEKSNADVKFNFENGGYFQSSLNINPVSGDFDAHLIIDQLYLDPFLNYVKPYAEINSFTGILNSKIDVIGNTSTAINSIISGEVAINNFKMTDLNDKEFLSAKSIKSDLEKIDYSNSNYVLNTLEISDSYSFFQLDSISNNFFRIFKLDNPEPEEGTADVSENIPEAKLFYAINNLIVTNGELDYTDNLTGQPFNYHLSEIKIDSDDIESTSKWIDIYSTMLLNNRGTLKANLGINPNNYLNSTLDISVEKFLLSDLNIYTNYYMGHSILAGDMYYNSKSKLVDGKIESENKLLVKNATLENTKEGLYSLPLKFAFFLLTDKNGDINLDIPVSGDLNDPEVSVGKIVWQSFKNIIGKTVAAPVNFLVGLVGGDPKDLEEIKFNYTDSIPSEKHYKQFDNLIKLEQKKAELKINLTYYVDRDLQSEALAKAQIGALFKKKTKKDYNDKEEDFKKFVYQKAGTDSLSLTDAIKNLVNKTALDSMVNIREQRLISTTKEYLNQQSLSTKIDVKKSDPEAPENTGAYPKFLITYGMAEESPLTETSDEL